MSSVTLNDNERSNSFLNKKTTRSVINRNSTEKDISDINIESKTLKLLWNIGPHKVCIIDKKIVEKLKVNEGDICEQQMTDDGNIILKIRKI